MQTLLTLYLKKDLTQCVLHMTYERKRLERLTKDLDQKLNDADGVRINFDDGIEANNNDLTPKMKIDAHVNGTVTERVSKTRHSQEIFSAPPIMEFPSSPMTNNILSMLSPTNVKKRPPLLRIIDTNEGPALGESEKKDMIPPDFLSPSRTKLYLSAVQDTMFESFEVGMESRIGNSRILNSEMFDDNDNDGECAIPMFLPTNIFENLHPQLKILLATNKLFSNIESWDIRERQTVQSTNLKMKKNIDEIWIGLKDTLVNDFTNVQLPIEIYEPLSLIQRLAENLKFYKLLVSASKEEKSSVRLGYVVAFALAMYSTTLDRCAAPFESVLGETYEYTSPDGYLQSVSEVVSDDPCLIASYTTSKDFEFSSNTRLKYEYLGKCLEIKPFGLSQVLLKPQKDKIIYNRGITAINNILSGKPYVDNYGEMKFVNLTNHETATVVLKKRSWDGHTYAMVEGNIKDGSNQVIYQIRGRWNDAIYLIDPATEERTLLWEAFKPQANESAQSFSNFTMQLNLLNQFNIVNLPPTDSRFRSDIRALENSQVEMAVDEQKRLATLSKKLTASSKHKPLWFQEKFDQELKESFYFYTNEYFKCQKADRFFSISQNFHEHP
jgi:hypothetical protein